MLTLNGNKKINLTLQWYKIQGIRANNDYFIINSFYNQDFFIFNQYSALANTLKQGDE